MKKANRVLLITENLGSGGAERQLVGLSVLLRQKGYHVKVITYYKNQFFQPDLLRAGVEYELLEEASSKLKRLPILYAAIRKFRPDTVISYLPMANVVMCILKIFGGFRLIISERSYTVDWGLGTKLRCMIYGVADALVCNTLCEAQNIKEHYPGLAPIISSIPNFIDVNKFSPSKELSSGDACNILSVGRIIPTKNTLFAIRVLHELRKCGYDFTYTCLGSQYDETYVEAVKQEILKLGLSDVVNLLEATDNPVAYYRQADIFFHPSLLEGYPNVICEAMSCELPIVCSNIGELPHVVSEGENGFLFSPNDVTAATQALERMIQMSAQERALVGRRNRETVCQRNSKDKFISSYIELL